MSPIPSSSGQSAHSNDPRRAGNAARNHAEFGSADRPVGAGGIRRPIGRRDLATAAAGVAVMLSAAVGGPLLFDISSNVAVNWAFGVGMGALIVVSLVRKILTNRRHH